MPEDRVRAQSWIFPVIKDAELRLVLRKRFEDMFRSLNLVHDEIEVTSAAARLEGQPEIANVLSYSVGNTLFGELKSLTNIVESLGGRTNLSEVEESTKEVVQRGGTNHGE